MSGPANTGRQAKARSAEIVAIFAASSEPLSIEDVWEKVRRTSTRGEVARTVGTLRSSGRLETVHRGYGRDTSTYRLAREAKSA